MANKDMERLVISGLDEHNYILVPDTTLSKDGVPADAGAVGDALEEVSEDIGEVQEDLSTLNSEGTVPTSEQMLSDNYTEDSVPYHFRKTASDNADREEVEIVGGSVVWNQLVKEADFNPSTNWFFQNGATNNGISNGVCDTSFSASISSQIARAVTLTSGHVFFSSVEIKLADATSALNFLGGASAVLATAQGTTAWQTLSAIWNGAPYTHFIIRNPSGVAVNNALIKNPQIFDLTTMFGSTIADHIYALEQATAGAGVALFKSLFPKDYYAYDAGSMQSVSGLSEHRTVGKNLLPYPYFHTTRTVNGVTFTDNKDGTITANGTAGSGGAIFLLHNNSSWKNLPPGTYRLTGCPSGGGQDTYRIHIQARPAGLQDIGNASTAQENSQVTLPSGSNAYIFIGAGTTVNNLVFKPMLTIDTEATCDSYSPYSHHSYALDDSLTLRGIPTLVDGKIKFDGDIYSPSGKVKRRYGIVDLGTLSWTYYASIDSTPSCFYAELTGKENQNDNYGVCGAYVVSESNGVNLTNARGYLTNDKMLVLSKDSSKPYVYVRDDAYADAAAFKTAMSGVYLVYELATPTTEQADPYINPQICHYDGTEEFVSTGIVPVGHVTKYPDNMRMKLDNLPWNFASLIAPTESGFKATRNYTTGALLIVNNVLYKATANIANGGTITVGTNVTATTLAEVISALS